MNTMYSENVYFPDVFKGCKHACIYCKPSFQRQAMRQRKNCQKCYTFEPHSHLERLRRKAPKTPPGKFVFFPKGGDVAFCPAADFLEMLKYAEDNPQTTFLIQTKDPRYFYNFHYPKNVILNITFETNRSSFDTPSIYENYLQISLAPSPFFRLCLFLQEKEERKALTIEPILQFDLEEITEAILAVKPEFVYIGYDTKKCHLPEPRLEETKALIAALKRLGIDVRLKTIRPAWYETVAGETMEK